MPWVSQDENLRWQTKKIVSYKRYAIESAQDAQKDGSGKGETIVAEIDWLHSDSQKKKKPSEWFAEQQAKAAKSLNFPNLDEE